MLALGPEDVITDAEYILEDVAGGVTACSHGRDSATGADARAGVLARNENAGR